MLQHVPKRLIQCNLRVMKHKTNFSEILAEVFVLHIIEDMNFDCWRKLHRVDITLCDYSACMTRRCLIIIFDTACSYSMRILCVIIHNGIC